MAAPRPLPPIAPGLISLAALPAEGLLEGLVTSARSVLAQQQAPARRRRAQLQAREAGAVTGQEAERRRRLTRARTILAGRLSGAGGAGTSAVLGG